MALVLVAGGGIAAATTDVANPYLLTTQIFPETEVRVQEDVLTRTSATDLDGCRGVHQGCLRTAEFDFTTSDSDAVVRLRIVERWLRWPAAQLEYAFRRAIDYSLLYEPKVSETQAPKS